MLKVIFISILAFVSAEAFDFGGLVDSAVKEISDDKGKDSKSTLSTLSDSTVEAGLRSALKIGVEYGVKELSKPEGYLKNSDVKIELPKNLQTAESVVRKFGGDKIADDLINSMNAAATEAAPKTAVIFVKSVDNMGMKDVKEILAGDDTAATAYFEKNTTKDLQKTIKPIIEKAMADNNVASYYKTFSEYYDEYAKEYVQSSSVMNMAKGFGADEYIPKDSNTTLEDHVVDKAISGLFHMIGSKESAIRNDTASQTTSLLKKVFGN